MVFFWSNKTWSLKAEISPKLVTFFGIFDQIGVIEKTIYQSSVVSKIFTQTSNLYPKTFLNLLPNTPNTLNPFSICCSKYQSHALPENLILLDTTTSDWLPFPVITTTKPLPLHCPQPSHPFHQISGNTSLSPPTQKHPNRCCC